MLQMGAPPLFFPEHSRFQGVLSDCTSSSCNTETVKMKALGVSVESSSPSIYNYNLKKDSSRFFLVEG